MAERRFKKPQGTRALAPRWAFRLYVAGQSPRSSAAVRNLTALCEKHLAGQYSIQVIDLLKDPELATKDQIVAVPTLVRKLPRPLRKIIGDLSDTEKVMVGLEIEGGGEVGGS